MAARRKRGCIASRAARCGSTPARSNGRSARRVDVVRRGGDIPGRNESVRAALEAFERFRQEDLMDKRRRKWLQTSAAVGAGALATGAMPAGAQAGTDVLFAHPGSFIPVLGSPQRFAVRRIYCVGRNYAAHSREMGSDPNREPPFFFQKPTDAIQNVAIGTVGDHPYPLLTKNYHYEVELVAALKSGGTNISADKALDHVYGYAVGLDMTRRDLQRALGDEK